MLWTAIGDAIAASPAARRLVSNIEFAFSDGAMLHAWVPSDWDDARALTEFTAVAEDVYARCGVALDDDRRKRIEMDIGGLTPILVQLDANYMRRETEKFRRENGTSAGAVDG